MNMKYTNSTSRVKNPFMLISDNEDLDFTNPISLDDIKLAKKPVRCMNLQHKNLFEPEDTTATFTGKRKNYKFLIQFPKLM